MHKCYGSEKPMEVQDAFITNCSVYWYKLLVLSRNTTFVIKLVTLPWRLVWLSSENYISEFPICSVGGCSRQQYSKIRGDLDYWAPFSKKLNFISTAEAEQNLLFVLSSVASIYCL